jgi:hypothetical protein
MRYFRTILTLTPLLLSPAACEDTSPEREVHWLTVQGTIRAAEDGSPIEGAKVRIDGGETCSGDFATFTCEDWVIVTQTNRFGNYSLRFNVECWHRLGSPGSYQYWVVSEKRGYETARRGLDCSATTASVDLNLEPV